MRNKRSALFYAAWSALALLLMLLIGRSAGVAQTSQAPIQRSGWAFPVVPLIIEYEYIPLYFMQWTDDDLHYSRIAASVYPGEVPVYQIMLTEKAGGNVYYCNSKSRIEALRREAKQAHLAAIDFKVARTVGQPPTYGFGFRDAHGRAVLWRFTPASRPSERGAGLTPQPQTAGLRLMYRNLGTTAGAGTAVQIGERVSEAQPWPEISSPPYFVAYRGSHSEGMDNGALLSGSESWRVASAPNITSADELREGAEWTFREGGGRERTLRVTARRGDEITIADVHSQAQDAAKLQLIGRVLSQGFALREVRLKAGGRSMSISFTPELNLANALAGAGGNGGGDVNFEVALGNNRKVAQGTISIERQDSVLRLRWRLRSPEWARSRDFVNTIKMDAAGYMIEASQAPVQKTASHNNR